MLWYGCHVGVHSRVRGGAGAEQVKDLDPKVDRRAGGIERREAECTGGCVYLEKLSKV